MPVFSPYRHASIVSPFAVARNISLLMRFDYPVGDGKSLVAHHGHRLRKELTDMWDKDPLPGSDLGLRSTKVRACAQPIAWLSACSQHAWFSRLHAPVEQWHRCSAERRTLQPVDSK